MKFLEKDGNKLAAALTVASALAAGYSVHTMFSALNSPVALAQENQDEKLAKEVSDSYYIEEQTESSVPEALTLSDTNSIPEQSEELNVVESDLPTEPEAAPDQAAFENEQPADSLQPEVQVYIAPEQEAPAADVLEEVPVTPAASVVEQAPVTEMVEQAPVEMEAQPVIQEEVVQPEVEQPEIQPEAIQPEPALPVVEEEAPVEAAVDQIAPEEVVADGGDGPTAEISPDPVAEIPVLEEAPTYETAEDPTAETPEPAPVQPTEPEPVQPVEPAPADPVVPDEIPAPEQPVETPVEPAPVDPVEDPADVPIVEVPSDQYSELNARIADEALKLVGVTDGWQCTEVVQAALANAGVQDAASLWPREYEAMYGYATDNPQAGNLVYYNQGGDGLDHIAVYIGDGQAVHGNYITDGVSQTVVASVEVPGCTDYTYIQVER